MEKAPELNAGNTYSGDATYNQEVAAAQHAFETSLYGDQEALKDAWANASYQRNLMGKSQPEALESNANRMNSEGLLESGANTAARTSILNAAQQRRNAISNSLAQNETKTAKAEEAAEIEGKDKIAGAVTASSDRAAKAKAESEERQAREASAAAAANASLAASSAANQKPWTPGSAPGTASRAGYAGQGMAPAPPGYKWVRMPGGSYNLKRIGK
jgi:hypothetical protein